MSSVTTTHPRGMLWKHAARRNEMGRRRRQGLTHLVDASRVQKHIRALCDAGYDTESVAAAAGCADSTVQKILSGQRNSVHGYVARGILAVGYRPVPAQAGRRVPNVGVVRRLNALRAAGWTNSHIGAELGRPSLPGNLLSARRSDRPVRYETWRDIADVYDRLTASRGPSGLTAARVNSPTPWDWETANIDDPTSWPADIPEPAKADKKHTAAAMALAGLSASQIAETLGVSERTVVRWRN